MKQTILRYILLLIGAAIAAIALEQILIPVQIMDGGMVGVSILIGALTGIPLSILTICCNLPFVLIGGKHLGERFVVRTIYSMIFFSVFLSIFSRNTYSVTKDPLLATVFGGILLGFGIGIILRNGGCLDGTETIAILLSRRTSLSVGQVVLCFNVVLYLIASCLFGLDHALYSMLSYVIASKVVDFINTGLDQGKAVMIITNEGKQIADDIYQTLGRTVTFIKGEGLISGEKTILYCVITRIELSTLRKIIEKNDYSAFMTISDVSEIVGRHIKSNEGTAEQI